MTQNQRSYHAFVRAAKSSYGLSQREAQQMYRSMRDRLEHAPRAKELKEHPRIAKQEAGRAAATLAGKKGARAATARARAQPAKAVTPAKAAESRRHREVYDDFEDSNDYEIFEDSPEAEY
jgi:hypothetical protein